MLDSPSPSPKFLTLSSSLNLHLRLRASCWREDVQEMVPALKALTVEEGGHTPVTMDKQNADCLPLGEWWVLLTVWGMGGKCFLLISNLKHLGSPAHLETSQNH